MKKKPVNYRLDEKTLEMIKVLVDYQKHEIETQLEGVSVNVTATDVVTSAIKKLYKDKIGNDISSSSEVK